MSTFCPLKHIHAYFLLCSDLKVFLSIMSMNPLKAHLGAGEMAKWLTAFAVLTEDLGSVPGPMLCSSQLPLTPTSGDPVLSSGL